ncbi:MAG: exonuclease SbcCD subunit D [Suilimivivens sp.]
MKLLHTADLHIGKIVNDFSMLEDQKFILEQIEEIACVRQADGVILAGDIYDRAIPTGEAVMVFNDFLTRLSKKGIAVYMISGNHDSPERISYGESLLAKQKVAIGGVFRGELSVFRAEDEYGTVEMVLLPFIKPSQAEEKTSGAAVEKVIRDYWKKESEDADKKKRRVLVTHFFVTDAGREPELSDSETTIHVGGLDNVDASLFDGFDYVALGHIHKPQQIGNKPVYYAGSPLKYSFGEVNQTKSVLLITLDETGLNRVENIPLHPLHEMRKVEGTMKEIMDNALRVTGSREDYIQAVLTDREELIDPIGTLRSVYPSIMQIVRKEREEKAVSSVPDTIMIKQKEPVSLFEDFYHLVRGEGLTPEKKELIEAVVREVEDSL